jgi:tetratricopeptide (TPR) repeat protein
MKTKLVRLFALLLTLLVGVSPVLATCGGGGGGGGGGMSSGSSSSSSSPEVYYVPWKVRAPKDPPAMGLILYWFPLSNDELQKSSMRASRVLSLYSAQCVAMEIGDYRTPAAQKLIGESKPPLAVLATHDGTAIGKAEGKNGFLKVDQAEKLVDTEVKRRESAVDENLKDAKEKVKAGANAAAIEILRAVVDQKCMFSKKAKDAAKELKKLGVTDIASIADSPVFDARESARIERTMRSGLKAELNGRYREAERLYSLAHKLDPADPTPLRYLAEIYRHDTGEWEKARTAFNAILNMQSDPLSRAVALHGLGKMTIHDGEFKKGLALMEQSVGEYPLALTYRNLAVYWNSEGDPVKGNDYTQKALAMDPKDPYNLVFAAVFLAANGKRDEALKIARANVALLPASYNLAAIYAQNGQRDKALAMLKRHFYQYERYRAVRQKEMMEARVDAVFDSLRQDPAFVALTNDADGKLPLPMKGMGTGTRSNN